MSSLQENPVDFYGSYLLFLVNSSLTPTEMTTTLYFRIKINVYLIGIEFCELSFFSTFFLNLLVNFRSLLFVLRFR